MTKQEFKERVGAIAENLTEAMYQYQDGNIDIHTFKQIMRDEMAEYPYDWMILTGDLQEAYDAFHLEEDELYHIDEVGASADDFKEFVADYISNAHNWDNAELNIGGSASFLTTLLGDEGLNY